MLMRDAYTYTSRAVMCVYVCVHTYTPAHTGMQLLPQEGTFSLHSLIDFHCLCVLQLQCTQHHLLLPGLRVREALQLLILPVK